MFHLRKRYGALNGLLHISASTFLLVLSIITKFQNDVVSGNQLHTHVYCSTNGKSNDINVRAKNSAMPHVLQSILF
jgi:hypothetical protein